MSHLNTLLYIIASYFLGAIPFAILICYLLKGVDVRDHGSGNAGATNVYRVAGPFAAILVSILDIAKGFVPVILAKSLAPEVEWLHITCGLAAVLGHVFPLFTHFRGGKGVNTLLGVFLVLLPLEVAISVAVFAAVAALTRIVSLGSMTAGVFLSVIVLIEKYAIGKNISTLLLSSCLAVSLLVLFTHRANFKRLIKSQEKKLSR